MVMQPVKKYKDEKIKQQKGDGDSNPVGAASIAAGRGLAKMTESITRGTLVDVPLALTEGLHNVPAMYGGTVRDHGKVDDWKSGGIVAGKVRAWSPITKPGKNQ